MLPPKAIEVMQQQQQQQQLAACDSTYREFVVMLVVAVIALTCAQIKSRAFAIGLYE